MLIFADKGGRGVSQLLILSDKGRRGGVDPPFLAANNKRKSTQVNKPMLVLSESSDEEVDGNNSIFE